MDREENEKSDFWNLKIVFCSYEANISQIQIDVESDNNPKAKGIKLGELLGTSSPGEKKPREKIKGKKNSKKQILEDFAKEAGTIKRSKNSQ